MNKRPMINEALKLLRLYFRESQSDLAMKIGVSQSMISDIESGRKSVSIELLDKYSSNLGIKMSQLLFFAEELGNEPPNRRGKLIIAEKILYILEKLKPNDLTETQKP